MDSPEPSIDKRTTEEGRKGGEVVHYTDWQEGARVVERQSAWQVGIPESGLQKQRGWTE